MAKAHDKKDKKEEKKCRQALSSIKMRDKDRRVEKGFLSQVAIVLSLFEDKGIYNRALANFDNDKITDD